MQTVNVNILVRHANSERKHPGETEEYYDINGCHTSSFRRNAKYPKKNPNADFQKTKTC